MISTAAESVHILLAIDDKQKKESFFNHINRVIRTIPELKGVHIYKTSTQDVKKKGQSIGSQAGKASPSARQNPIKLLTIVQDQRKPSKTASCIDFNSPLEEGFKEIYDASYSIAKAIPPADLDRLNHSFLYTTDNQLLPPSRIPQNICIDFSGKRNDSDYPRINSLPRINFSNSAEAITNLRYFFRKLVGDFGLFENVTIQSFTSEEQGKLRKILGDPNLSNTTKSIFRKLAEGLSIKGMCGDMPYKERQNVYSIILDSLYNQENFEKVKRSRDSIEQYHSIINSDLIDKVKKFLAQYQSRINDLNPEKIKIFIYAVTGILIDLADQLIADVRQLIRSHNAQITTTRDNASGKLREAQTSFEFLGKPLFDNAFHLVDKYNQAPALVVSTILRELKDHLNISEELETDFKANGLQNPINKNDFTELEKITKNDYFSGEKLSASDRLRILVTIFSVGVEQQRTRNALYEYVRDYNNFNTIISRIAANQPAK